jgi:hypothetical protein
MSDNRRRYRAIKNTRLFGISRGQSGVPNLLGVLRRKP